MNETQTDGTAVQTVPQLLAHALAMETEAAERYGELADQMETHRRTAVAAIFRRLEVAEKKHLVDLTALCKDVPLPHYAAYPPKRVEQLLTDSENLRMAGDDWDRIWFLDQPSHLTPYRTHGGLGP